jgi:hypothetical protein
LSLQSIFATVSSNSFGVKLITIGLAGRPESSQR